jgi:hypothetical protein
MIQRAEALRDTLSGSLLDGREVVAVPVLDTGAVAFAVPIASAEIEAVWRAARALVDRTGLWPVASTFWSAGSVPFAQKVLEEDFFSRFYYEEAPNPDDVEPRSLCERAEKVNVAEFLSSKESEAEEDYGLDEYMESELDEVESRCGERPESEQIGRSTVDGKPIRTRYQFERWLHEFERARGFEADSEGARQEWFSQDPSVLLFLPTRSGWESLAYLNWYGTSDCGCEYYIALGKAWERRFGAELVAHYGTMLQSLVSRPPMSIEEAFPLAREHHLAGPCTLDLPGLLLRDYASALVGWDRWFLHERP